jgi:hypothetical protein
VVSNAIFANESTWFSPKWPFLWHFAVCHPFVLQNSVKNVQDSVEFITV